MLAYMALFLIISSVYDWTARKRILTFNNNNEPGTIITSLHCINQEVGGIIMAGSCQFRLSIFEFLFCCLTDLFS